MNSLMSVILEQAAEGKVRPAQMVNSIRNNERLDYGPYGVSFVKVRPGVFKVQHFEENEMVREEEASTPVEAKLLVIDAGIEAVKRVRANGRH